MTHNIRIICRSNSSPKINDNIHDEKNIDKGIEGEPQGLSLIFAVECNANRQHYHSEHQKDNDKYIPVPPIGVKNKQLKADTNTHAHSTYKHSRIPMHA